MDYLINEHLNLDKKNLFFLREAKKIKKKIKNLIKKFIFLKIKKRNLNILYINDTHHQEKSLKLEVLSENNK